MPIKRPILFVHGFRDRTYGQSPEARSCQRHGRWVRLNASLATPPAKNGKAVAAAGLRAARRVKRAGRELKDGYCLLAISWQTARSTRATHRLDALGGNWTTLPSTSRPSVMRLRSREHVEDHPAPRGAAHLAPGKPPTWSSLRLRATAYSPPPARVPAVTLPCSRHTARAGNRRRLRGFVSSSWPPPSHTTCFAPYLHHAGHRSGNTSLPAATSKRCDELLFWRDLTARGTHITTRALLNDSTNPTPATC